MDCHIMKKNLKQELLNERKLIAKCIFRGLTIAQIAKVLNYSSSTVSNRMTELFRAYNAKTRNEFIIKAFGEIIENKSMLLEEKNKKIERLSKEIERLKTIISNS